MRTRILHAPSALHQEPAKVIRIKVFIFFIFFHILKFCLYGTAHNKYELSDYFQFLIMLGKRQIDPFYRRRISNFFLARTLVIKLCLPLILRGIDHNQPPPSCSLLCHSEIVLTVSLSCHPTLLAMNRK